MTVKYSKDCFRLVRTIFVVYRLRRNSVLLYSTVKLRVLHFTGRQIVNTKVFSEF